MLIVSAAGTPPRPSRSSAPDAKPAADSAARAAAGEALQKDQAGSNSSSAATGAEAPAGGEADASARRVSRDTADSHAADNPSKVAAAAASHTEAKAAKQDAAAAGAAEKQKGANGAEGGKSQRTVADFAREVAALQEENKKLKQALHAQVGSDGLVVAPWLGYRLYALVLFLQRHAQCAESFPAGQARMLVA